MVTKTVEVDTYIVFFFRTVSEFVRKIKKKQKHSGHFLSNINYINTMTQLE